MKGKEYNSTGTDVELVAAMLDNLEEALVHYENNNFSEKDEKIIAGLKFTKKYIEHFAAQL